MPRIMGVLRGLAVAAVVLSLGGCVDMAELDGGTGSARGPLTTPSSTPTPDTDPPIGPAPGPCPRSGYRVFLAGRDAAMGLRLAVLGLENCSRRTIMLEGVPAVTFLGEDGKELPLRVRRGVTSPSFTDPGVHPIRLRPGQRATAQVTWRLLVELGEGPDLTGYRATVVARPGDGPSTIGLFLDSGTTGEVWVAAWQRPSVGGY